MGGVAIGVDVGGTTVAGGLVGADGEVLAHFQEPTHGRGPGTALATLLDLLGKLEGVARARGLPIAGAGIGVPGTVDAERGVIGADIHYVPDLAGAHLAAVVSGRLGQPVFVDNDVNVLALGEWSARHRRRRRHHPGGAAPPRPGRVRRRAGARADRLRRASVHLRRAGLPQGLCLGHRHRAAGQ
ncbi:MAG: hypothetical protein DMD83_20260 [Candidatus Rokuibacteriota bacterium]|nr:MAG: hypothetical protein DMD83_20260 [Candidatus Rokubacteria bacterium]